MSSLLNVLIACLAIILKRPSQLLFTLIFCLQFTKVFAQEDNSVAIIARATGETSIVSSNGESRKASVRKEIYSGDTIKTVDDAWLTINFFDLTRVVIRPKSEFIVRQFPQTISNNEIVLEFVTGGARIASGTMAAKNPDQFVVLTPEGKLTGGENEWVIRSCEGSCEELEQTFTRCANYESLEKKQSQFISVYKGELNTGSCSIQATLKSGETAVHRGDADTCKVIDQIPCFILSDSKLGKDKLRKFLPKLEPLEGQEAEIPENTRRQTRPNPRTQPRPRVNRPIRPNRGR